MAMTNDYPINYWDWSTNN